MIVAHLVVVATIACNATSASASQDAPGNDGGAASSPASTTTPPASTEQAPDQAPVGTPIPTEVFISLFDGKTLTGWEGDTENYAVEDGAIKCLPAGTNLYTAQEYGDFHLKLQFKLAPGSNNGIGIRAPKDGDAAYEGMEIQVLDDTASKYADLRPWQFCGSIYGIAGAVQGHLKPVGEWNDYEIIAKGPRIIVRLNDWPITDMDVIAQTQGGTIDDRDHPGLKRTSGHIVFCGHGDPVWFRAISIRPFK